MSKKIAIDLTDEAFEKLQDIIDRKNFGNSTVEVLKKALGLADFYSKETKDGARIFAEKELEDKIIRKEIVSI